MLYIVRGVLIPAIDQVRDLGSDVRTSYEGLAVRFLRIALANLLKRNKSPMYREQYAGYKTAATTV